MGISARQQLSAELLWPWPYCHSDGHEQKEETAMLIDKEDNSGEPLPGQAGWPCRKDRQIKSNPLGTMGSELKLLI